MDQAATIQQLTDRLRRIEAEIVAVREELKTLPEQRERSLPTAKSVPNTVNKAALKEQFQRMFRTLSIQDDPVGVETLQE